MAIGLGEGLLIGGGIAGDVFGGLLGASAESRRRKERESVRNAIFRLMDELRGRETPGILSPGQQETFVQQQLGAMAPTRQRFASILARRFGLGQPGVQMGLAQGLQGQEFGLRAGVAGEQYQRQFESEQRLRSLLASLAGSLPT